MPIAATDSATRGTPRSPAPRCTYAGSAAEIPSAEYDTWKPADFHPERVRQIDFTRNAFVAGGALARLPGVPEQPYAPFLVVDTSPAIIDGHSGFFSHRFTNFLVRYVADIEAKRLITRRQRLTAIETQRQRTR